MTFDDYSILVRKLYELNIKQQEYIDKIPLDIRDAFFDNEYTAAYSVMLTVVMRAALEPELFDLWNTMWIRLPDHPAIRRTPFLLLCDLCEYPEQ